MCAQTAASPRDRALIALAGVAPDLDAVGIVPELLTRNSMHPLPWFTEYHHILGHNIGFALLTTVIAFLLAREKRMTASLVFLSFHLHLICDLVGARGPDSYQWPIPYLLPFSNQADLVWHGQWALNAWPNFVITFVLLGTTVWFAVKRGFSPLELISKVTDHKVVAVLRQRLGSGQNSKAAHF